MASKIQRKLALSFLLFGAVAACTPGGEPAPGTPAGPGQGQSPAAQPGGQVPGAVGTTCPALAGLPTEQGDLVARLEAAKISPSGSEGFEEPGGTELVAFERAFETLLRDGPTETVRSDLSALGFALSVFQHEGGGSYVVVEEATSGSGTGTFVVNLAPARDMWLEAPHADSDEGTLRQTAEQLVELGARALVLTGSNRCASSTPTPCGGSTRMCGGQFRVSDAAHFDRNYFTAAHRALRTTYPDALAVQVHGMDSPGVEAAVVSNGTREAQPSSVSVRLRDALNNRLGTSARAFSCNDPADEGKYRPLCGTNNVQGGLDNGLTNSCTAKATTATDRFLHVEQNAELRLGASSRKLLEALADAVPCTLPGNGLSCPVQPVAAPACG